MRNIGLVQINNSFSGQNYFPYSAGLMQSYAQKYYKGNDNLSFKNIVYKRISVENAVNQIGTCDAVGFSIYVWNVRLSLKIAEIVKRNNPSCLIVFGGPQVPDDATDFMSKHRFIDVAVHGEGEQTFTEILNNLENRDFSNISSISYFDNNGNFIRKPRLSRLRDLEVIPSPYTTGTFSTLMTANPDEKWIVMWETNRGCPFSCTFCDWGSAIASKVNQFGFERLCREIDWFAENKIEFVFCCDANYGILPRDYDITKYVADTKLRTGYPQAMSVQNTKNATERAYKVQKLLSDAGLNKGVTISMQSMDAPTLTNIKRANISTESFQELQRRFTKDKVVTYSDMILGLPGETYDTFVDGIDLIISNGQHNRIQFNNLSLLPNAEMGDPEYQKKYGMKWVTSKIINIHGSLTELEDDSTQELQELVVSTDSMPREEWVKTRAYCWMVALLHFDKILQIPIILMNHFGKIKYKDIISAFTDETILKDFPTINEINKFFIDKAIDIQNGGEEYCESKEWLNIWWPADEYIFIKLTMESKMPAFYKEAQGILNIILEKYGASLPENILDESIQLNKSLLKLPFEPNDEVVTTSYNIFEIFNGVVIGENVELDHSKHTYTIRKSKAVYTDWTEWFREVVWYGNKKGAYLHGNEPEKEIEGHY